MASPTDWRALAQKKKDSILAAIPGKWRIPQSAIDSAPADLTGPFIQQFLSPSEVQITETPATGILERTTTGKWTAVSVAEAFSHRAAMAHQLTSCLSEVLFGPALDHAARLDAHMSAHGGPVGPLHGLPISLKDSVDVAGAGTALGFTSWAAAGSPPASQDAVIAAALRRQGAVTHAKTAVPQASFAGETFGAVSGYVVNPLRRDALSVGGSSGGEAALLALRGSVLGLGTDIGKAPPIIVYTLIPPHRPQGEGTLRTLVGMFPLSPFRKTESHTATHPHLNPPPFCAFAHVFILQPLDTPKADHPSNRRLHPLASSRRRRLRTPPLAGASPLRGDSQRRRRPREPDGRALRRGAHGRRRRGIPARPRPRRPRGRAVAARPSRRRDPLAPGCLRDNPGSRAGRSR